MRNELAMVGALSLAALASCGAKSDDVSKTSTGGAGGATGGTPAFTAGTSTAGTAAGDTSTAGTASGGAGAAGSNAGAPAAGGSASTGGRAPQGGDAGQSGSSTGGANAGGSLNTNGGSLSSDGGFAAVAGESGTGGAPDDTPSGAADICIGDGCPFGECDNAGFLADAACSDVYPGPLDSSSTYCASGSNDGYCLSVGDGVSDQWIVTCDDGTPTLTDCINVGCRLTGGAPQCG